MFSSMIILKGLIISGIVGIIPLAVSIPHENIKEKLNDTEIQTVELEEKILTIELNDGESIPNLSNNPDGYTTIVVTTIGNKILNNTDFARLKASKIPNIDLSSSKAINIQSYTFFNCSWLKSFKYPQGVTDIGEFAFKGCSGLTDDLIIPDSVNSIGEYTFYGCSGFTGNLIIPNSVTNIGSYAFYGCSGFTSDLTIPNSVTNIGSYAFYGCSGFTGDLTIPNSITVIEDSVFSGCSGFSGSLTIPESVTTIREFAFYRCNGFMGDLIIPNSVTTIDEYTFKDCNGFTGNLIISSSATNIGSYAFEGCNGFTGDLTIPNSVTNIGSYAFKNCNGFTGNLVISNSVTAINEYAFYECSGFTGNLVISNSATTISEYAFYGCSGFTGNLTIPDAVTTIGNSAFEGCSGFTGNLAIPDSVTNIGSYAFCGCSGLTGNLNIPKSVTVIEDSVFSGCRGFTGDLNIPNSVTTIRNYAFDECSGFTGNLAIPDSVTTIGSYAFYGCSGFTGNLVIPNSVITIENSVFSGCRGFTGDLTIPDSVITIGEYAFKGCSGFTGDLNIGSRLSNIPQGAFSHCSGLTGDLIIPDNITSIYLPSSLTEIYSPFYKCAGLTGNLIIGKGLNTFNNYSFNNYTQFNKIIIPTGDEFIDSNYRKSIIDILDKSKTIIDLSYNFNEVGTWFELETFAKVAKPVLKKVVAGEELDFDNTPSSKISLYIKVPYKESDITVMKDGQPYDLPTKINEKHMFSETGIYTLEIETITGTISNITFTVDSSIVDFNYTKAEDAVEKAETSLDITDIENARELVNQAPEGTKKEELQNRLNNISPHLTLERKISSTNLDVYIKSENILLMSIDTNSITFDNFSGVEDVIKENAINISVNSSLPYQLNAYLFTEIQSGDKSNTMDKSIFNIKENSELEYKYFANINEKIVLKDDCEAGNDKKHKIDVKLKGNIAHEKDIYKTAIKFEIKQK